MAVNNIQRYSIPVFLILIFLFGASVGQAASVNNGESPLILPTNPLYPIKSFFGAVEKFFTFGAWAKAKLDLKFLNERAREIQGLASKEEVNQNALKNAVVNYEKKLNSLKERMDGLKKDEFGASVDGFLELFTENALEESRIFQNLKQGDVQNKLDEVFVATIQYFDTGERFGLRLTTVLDSGGEVRDLNQEFRAVSVLTRWSMKAGGKMSRSISDVRSDLILRLEGGLVTIAKNKFFENLRLDSPDDIMAFEFVREWLIDPDLKSRFNIVRQDVLQNPETEKAINDSAIAEFINLVEKRLRDLETKINSGEIAVSKDVRQLFQQSGLNLEQAQKFYDGKQFTSAFSQAASALALTENCLEQMFQNKESLTVINKSLRSEFDKLTSRAKSQGLNRENAEKLFRLFDRAEKMIINAKTFLEMREAKSLLGQIEFSLADR